MQRMIIVDKSVYGKVISAVIMSRHRSCITYFCLLLPFYYDFVFKITVRKHGHVNSLPFGTYRIPVKCNLLKMHRAENETVAARIIKLVAH